MRYVYVNRATYALAALLVAAVLAFAWLRSQAITLVALQGDHEDVRASGMQWQDLGRQVYGASCAACHPRLPHVAELFQEQGARSYLLEFMLFGHEGEVVIQGRRLDLDHPEFADLSDAEISAVLNHMLVSWEDARPRAEYVDFFRPAEVRETRLRELSPPDVAERRPNR